MKHADTGWYCYFHCVVFEMSDLKCWGTQVCLKDFQFRFCFSWVLWHNTKSEEGNDFFFIFSVCCIVTSCSWKLLKSKSKKKKKKRKNLKQKHCLKGVHLELFCFKFYLNVCYQLNLISEFRCAMLYATKCEMQIPTKWLEFSDFENSDFPKN